MSGRRGWDAIEAAPHRGIGQPTAGAVAVIRRVIGPIARLLFRPRVDGIEYIRSAMASGQPFVLVANHSAGLGVAEIVSFASLYIDRIGPDRPLAGFAHPLGFRIWPLSAIHRHVGTVPSTYPAAAEALARGVPLLIFPGGDHETLRPFWQADRVDFGGRKGFVRIARRAGVPIVPLGIRGGHHTAPILLRADPLAWLLIQPRLLLGQRRWSVSLLGLVGAALLLALDLSWPARLVLAALWLGSPLTLLPWVPATVRFRFGPPVPLDDLRSATGEDDLDGMRDRVEAAVQALVKR